MQAVLLAEVRRWMEPLRETVITVQPVCTVDGQSSLPLQCELYDDTEQLFNDSLIQSKLSLWNSLYCIVVLLFKNNHVK